MTLLLLDIDLDKAVSPSGAIMPTRSEAKQYVRPVMITFWLAALATAMPVWTAVSIVRGMKRGDHSALGR